MLDRIKDFIKKMNVNGVPLPMVTDPRSKIGSVTVSLVVISCACVVASLISNKVDKSGSLSFFAISLSSYLGRKIITKDTTIDSEPKA